MKSIPACMGLPELLSALSRAIQSSPERAASAGRTADRARGLASRLPLVHRTGDERGGDIREIFRQLSLRAAPLSQDRLERALGWGEVVFFFLGYPAFPEGNIVLVLSREPHDQCTFTPFDTGAIRKGHLAPAEGTPWEDADRVALMREHHGDGRDLPGFLPEYLAGHFPAPEDYVRERQKCERGLQRFPAYHGLLSRSNDRRAWTIEVQSHLPVLLTPERVLLIVVDGPLTDIQRIIPGHLHEKLARFDPEASGYEGEFFEEYVARKICDMLQIQYEDAQ